MQFFIHNLYNVLETFKLDNPHAQEERMHFEKQIDALYHIPFFPLIFYKGLNAEHDDKKEEKKDFNEHASALHSTFTIASLF